jgi:CBS domain containing-hemolysin-like protein
MEWTGSVLWLSVAILLVIVNGFFVAAEFALVKVRRTQLKELVEEQRAGARTSMWLADRMNRALSACQLGITMASLGLGWVGEPAIARLLQPVFEFVGVTSEIAVHAIAFVIAFTLITAAHLVIGEQAPKIYAIRRPERLILWCAMPLKWFYVASYPFLVALAVSTDALLRVFGMESGSDHEQPHTEVEIRALLSSSHAIGEISRAEHRLINNVFDFDDTIVRQVMTPRTEVEFLDVRNPFAALMNQARESNRTRLPVCDGSMDHVLGVVHAKNLFRLAAAADDVRAIMHPPRYIPETMRISKVLAHFQAARQHLAFVVDEYGSVIGIVTLENVLERIVGSVEDEFDSEPPDVVQEGPGRFIVQGSSPLDIVNQACGASLSSHEVDTISGFVTQKLGRIVETGDRIDVGEVAAEVLEAEHARAVRIRIIVRPADDVSQDPESTPGDPPVPESPGHVP